MRRRALLAAGGFLTAAGALLPALHVGPQTFSGIALARALLTQLMNRPAGFDPPALIIVSGALLANLTALMVVAWGLARPRRFPRYLVSAHAAALLAAAACSLLVPRLPAARLAPGYGVWLLGLLLLCAFAVLASRRR